MGIPYLYQEIDRIYAKTLGRGIRSLCVTSSMPNEGTTSVVCALAQRARAVNLNVLVVDMNLYNPVVSRMISADSPAIDNTLLLSNQAAYLTDNSDTAILDNDTGDIAQSDNNVSSMIKPKDWDNAMDYHARQVSIRNGPTLPVIPIPKDEKNPVKFREHTMLNRMIEQWLVHYDCVIFDTSPLCLINQKNIPAQHVATCCDAAVVVVKSGQTQTHQLKEAMEILQTVEVNLAGTVVNDYENPLLGVELLRQCDKLGKRLPRLSNWLSNKIKSKGFLFGEY